MESPIYYSSLENLNRGLMNEMEELKEMSKLVKQEEVWKETKEERKLRRKAKGEFDIDSDEEEGMKEKEK